MERNEPVVGLQIAVTLEQRPLLVQITDALSELRRKLSTTPERFTPENLEKAHAARYHKSLVDIISMVKHAAREEEPLLTASERVEWRRSQRSCAP